MPHGQCLLLRKFIGRNRFTAAFHNCPKSFGCQHTHNAVFLESSNDLHIRLTVLDQPGCGPPILLKKRIDHPFSGFLPLIQLFSVSARFRLTREKDLALQRGVYSALYGKNRPKRLCHDAAVVMTHPRGKRNQMRFRGVLTGHDGGDLLHLSRIIIAAVMKTDHISSDETISERYHDLRAGDNIFPHGLRHNIGKRPVQCLGSNIDDHISVKRLHRVFPL